LALWASSKLVSSWLNRSPLPAGTGFCEGCSFFTSRRIADLAVFLRVQHRGTQLADSGQLQEQPLAIAARVSPTNIGFLLNARQVACEFGYLTVPEFAERTLRTLATSAKLKKHHGHV